MLQFILGLFKPGSRTITLSVIFCVLAVILQIDYQGIIHLMPLLKTLIIFAMTIIGPLVPVFLRKGINNALDEGIKKNLGEAEERDSADYVPDVESNADRLERHSR